MTLARFLRDTHHDTRTPREKWKDMHRDIRVLRRECARSTHDIRREQFEGQVSHSMAHLDISSGYPGGRVNHRQGGSHAL